MIFFLSFLKYNKSNDASTDICPLFWKVDIPLLKAHPPLGGIFKLKDIFICLGVYEIYFMDDIQYFYESMMSFTHKTSASEKKK